MVKITDFAFSKHFGENFRYFRQFSLINFRKNENKFSRKCKNKNFLFNPSCHHPADKPGQRKPPLPA
jgi:hypothetical protein